MRSIIDLIMAVAICLCSVITVSQCSVIPQEPLDSRVAVVNVKYDAVISNAYDSTSRTAKPHPKALLEQIHAVEGQASDLVEELGCLKGTFSLECGSLLLKGVVLQFTLLVTEYECKKLEKEQEKIIGAGAQKVLK